MIVMNLFLIGPMGAGKTTVGRALAKRLQRDFYDCDHEIVARCGVDIPTIFEFEGETGFRDRESQALIALSQLEGVVIATGGGAILREQNRQTITRSAVVIYLRISVEEQLLRIAKDRNRPLLQAPDVKQKLEDLAIERNPLYDDMADIKLDTNRQHVNHVVHTLLHHLSLKYQIEAS